jgi:hypothetical protein
MRRVAKVKSFSCYSPFMSNEQAKKDYLKALASYEEHLSMAAYSFLLLKYSERKIKNNPDLIDRHMDEFTNLIANSNGPVYQWVRDDLRAMKEAESRM